MVGKSCITSSRLPFQVHWLLMYSTVYAWHPGICRAMCIYVCGRGDMWLGPTHHGNLVDCTATTNVPMIWQITQNIWTLRQPKSFIQACAYSLTGTYVESVILPILIPSSYVAFQNQLSIVSCPDSTQITRGEGAWCHKSKSLGQQTEAL